MDRYRIVLAIALSLVILIGWPLIMRRFSPPPPEPAPETQQTEQQPSQNANKQPAPRGSSPQPSSQVKPGPGAPPQTHPAPVSRTEAPEREITISTRFWIAKLSSRGAVATSWKILGYPEDGGTRAVRPAEGGGELELIPPDLPPGATGPADATKPFSLFLPWSPAFARELNNSNFQIEGIPADQSRVDIQNSTSELKLVFSYATPQGTARKTFVFSDDRFVFDVAADVNVGGTPQPVELVIGPRIGDQSDRQTGSYSQPPHAIVFTKEGKREQFAGAKITPPFATVTAVDHASNSITLDKPLAPDVNVVKLVADKGATLLGYSQVAEASPDRRTLTLDAVPQSVVIGTGAAQGTDTIRQGYLWAGIADHYFTMLAVGTQPIPEVTLTDFEHKADEKNVLDFPSVAIPIGQGLHVFVGPKDRDLLAAVGQELHTSLDGLIDWGLFSFAVRPLIPVLAWSLKSFASIFNNYGWAIVVVTLVINILLSPLRLYSSTKMKKAAKHQPRLKELQERMKKLKENPKKNERELMQLQQEQLGIMKEANPLGGCMPMLLQMPIFWAVYLYLGSSLDVRHEQWIGWIHDLSKPDRLYILPIIMCVTMIASTQLTPQPPSADPSMKMQRIMMTWLMPIMLTWFFFFSAPSGLVLYWMVSNLVGVLIQLVINKKTAHLTAELAPATSKSVVQSGKGNKPTRRRGAEAEGFDLKTSR